VTRLVTPKSKTEAQAFLAEAYPFPRVFTALAMLALGNIAVTISTVLSFG
jgi:hypothetical protein